jgi:hypothetical protein
MFSKEKYIEIGKKYNLYFHPALDNFYFNWIDGDWNRNYQVTSYYDDKIYFWPHLRITKDNKIVNEDDKITITSENVFEKAVQDFVKQLKEKQAIIKERKMYEDF